MARSPSPAHPANRLLASLPRADLARLTPSLEHVDLPLGQRLHEPGFAQEHFYFPGTSIVSLVGVLRNGDATNIEVEQSSGVPSLDISAVRALQRIDTFGPLPPDYPGGKISVEYWFDYKR